MTQPANGSPFSDESPDTTWRATTPRSSHPITPLVRITRMIPVIGGVLLAMGTDGVRAVGVSNAVVVALVLALAISGWYYVQWTRFRYWFDADGDLRVRSGVLQVNERRVQVSRLQSVDVTQPLLARLFGMAAVRPEVAGAKDRGTRIEYLLFPDAQRLRAELLARAAGIHSGDEAPAPVAGEQHVLSVPAAALLESVLLQPASAWALVAATGTLIFALTTTSWQASIPSLLILLSPVFVVGGQFLNWFGFSVASSPDGLRLRFGLTEHRAQTVPPGRVQALRFDEPLLWRHRGWVRVWVNVAGATSGNEAKERPSILVPVAPRDVARSVVAQVLPGIDPFAVELTGVPRRARWLSPWQFRQMAAGANESVFVVRSGWLIRRWDVIPHARSQSVRVSQGAIQRLFHLASLHVDSTPGPVSVKAAHRDEATVRQWAQDQADRAMVARATSAPDRWMQHLPSQSTSLVDEHGADTS